MRKSWRRDFALVRILQKSTKVSPSLFEFLLGHINQKQISNRFKSIRSLIKKTIPNKSENSRNLYLRTFVNTSSLDQTAKREGNSKGHVNPKCQIVECCFTVILKFVKCCVYLDGKNWIVVWWILFRPKKKKEI